MKLNILTPDPSHDYTCDICNGTGYTDSDICGMCEGGGEVCWRPVDSQWIAVPVKYRDIPLAELERICEEKYIEIEKYLDTNIKNSN